MNAIKVADHELDFWADRFIADGLGDAMTFEEYMSLTLALRERRSRMLCESERHIGQMIDRLHPDAALHGTALIEPIHHGVREFRRPWFRNHRNHV